MKKIHLLAKIFLRNFLTFLITGCVAGATTLLVATSIPAEQPGNTKSPEPKYTEVHYSADVTSYRWVDNNETLILRGNVTFTQGDMTLTADKVEYQKNSQTATASGNLKITDNRITITADSCSVNFKEKKGILAGNVCITSIPKQKSNTTSNKNTLKSNLEGKTVITCQSVEYYYKSKKAVIPTPLTIVQENKTVTADSGTYFVDEERALLIGNVKGIDEKRKHSFTGQKVTVSLKEGDEWIEIEKASGTFYIKEEQESQTESQPTEKSAK
jgi:lipopolysaccharide assembly outer membrane protein LptD (OstA)